MTLDLFEFDLDDLFRLKKIVYFIKLRKIPSFSKEKFLLKQKLRKFQIRSFANEKLMKICEKPESRTTPL